MRLISLELENFRQHSSTRIDFYDGITAIIGANGSGKSTVLEAITWAIYGTEAARGTKDSIKWNKVTGRSKVRAELVFSIDNETFRVKRELNKAEVYLEPNQTSLAVTQDEVTKYLTEKLGMNRVEFFNTYFTGQKELDFLGSQKPAERRKFISNVLNYEKVREAQEKARLNKNSLNNEILGIKQGLGDIDSLLEEKKQHQEKIELTKKILSDKKAEKEKYTLELGKLHPDWSKIKTKRENFNKFSTELRFVEDKFKHLQANIKNLTEENKSLEEKAKKLENLESHIENYKKIEKQIQEQENLQKFEIEKQKILTKLENIENETKEYTKKINSILSSTESKKETSAKIESLKKEIKTLKENIQEETKNWTSRKQEIKTIKKQKETELNKTATQYSVIMQKGKEGSCPTCERPLKNEFDKVTQNFNEIIEGLSQEISKLSLEEDQLITEPESITKNKTLLNDREKDLENTNKVQVRLEEELKQSESFKKEIEKRKELKAELNQALEKIPHGFDEKALGELKEKFASLKKIYDEVLGLKAHLTNIEKIKSKLEEYTKMQEETEAKKLEFEKALKEIEYSEEEYKKIEEQVINTEQSHQQAEKDLIQSESEFNQINAILDRLIESEKVYNEKLNLVSNKQDELNHLTELDRFYGQFLEKLNNLARPELSEYASKFLTELTDGRYSMLELNDKYEICLYDDGELKPVISGGEEDIANLCVRLAISQMIAQRSGKTLSLLILDEVFGSLDESRRNKVISVLHELTNSFEQVVIITHIDDLKESVDNIIKVEYDEEKGCSIVSQQETSKLSKVSLEKLEKV